MLDTFITLYERFVEVMSPAFAVFSVIWNLAPIWAPILFAFAAWQTWVRYIRAQYLADQEYVLLEVKIPREQEKSPLAMEVVLNALHQTGGESNFIQKYWQGSVRAWFSLELVSVEGNVHFFIWTPAFFRPLIENAIYSQYPNIEVHEVPDYTNFLEYDQEKIDLWGCEFETVQSDVYPIKTYIDYGLDKNPEEEEKIDPLTSTLEYLGGLQQGEQVWIQILVQAHKDSWRDRADKEIDELLHRDPSTKAPIQAQDSPFGPRLSDEEEKVASAIKRSTAKKAFECGIRGIYMAESDSFRAVNIPGLIGSFRQYDSANLNGFKPTRGLIKFSYPWQDYNDIRKNKTKRLLFDAYRRRSFFHPPYKRSPFILNSEELATLFHFPGSVAQTPTFGRIESKKAEPPTNLPS